MEEKDYSKRFHLDFIERYRIIGVTKPIVAVMIPKPIARFIISVTIEVPQSAKNGHFFHMNKSITKTKLANIIKPYKPYTYHTQIAIG